MTSFCEDVLLIGGFTEATDQFTHLLDSRRAFISLGQQNLIVAILRDNFGTIEERKFRRFSV